MLVDANWLSENAFITPDHVDNNWKNSCCSCDIHCRHGLWQDAYADIRAGPAWEYAVLKLLLSTHTCLYLVANCTVPYPKVVQIVLVHFVWHHAASVTHDEVLNCPSPVADGCFEPPRRLFCGPLSGLSRSPSPGSESFILAALDLALCSHETL